MWSRAPNSEVLHLRIPLEGGCWGGIQPKANARTVSWTSEAVTFFTPICSAALITIYRVPQKFRFPHLQYHWEGGTHNCRCQCWSQINLESKLLMDPVRHCEISPWASPCYYFHPSLSPSPSSTSSSSLSPFLLAAVDSRGKCECDRRGRRRRRERKKQAAATPLTLLSHARARSPRLWGENSRQIAKQRKCG